VELNKHNVSSGNAELGSTCGVRTYLSKETIIATDYCACCNLLEIGKDFSFPASEANVSRWGKQGRSKEGIVTGRMNRHTTADNYG
jgi:hypothetical protein